MKTFDERMASIREKSAFEKKKLRNRRIVTGALAGVITIALALVLFMPYSTTLPDVSRYSSSPYYNVIRGLNKATYTPPVYKNNFEFLASVLSVLSSKRAPTDSGILAEGNGIRPGAVGDVLLGGQVNGDPMAPTTAVPDKNESMGNYEEVTDNQVEGVIEADLFKRSDKYLYYLKHNELRIYSIAQADTTLAGIFCIDPLSESGMIMDLYGAEMYLSQDCTTVTILMEGYSKEAGSVAAVMTLDVSDPANITQTGTLLFEGSYISSRMVGDDILLTYNYGFNKGEIDFDNPETFVPQYGAPGDMQLLAAGDIICPEDVSSTRYTIVAKLDGKSLEVKDTAALMSYSQQLYVSEDTIYATHSFTKNTDEGINTYNSVTMTEITGISYLGDTLEVLGSVQIEGSVKDQYSMDQFNGILRVATSTTEQKCEEYTSGGFDYSTVRATMRNCSLYCIDLSSWEIAASVEKFAPNGDEVTSARFDGHMAYICTAEVIVLTDPVFFFDLSDLNNITWTDTGIIDGYSSSLVNFGDYLLGIGFSDDRGLKLEAYVESASGVESIGVYERWCSYPADYKAYFIDRENNLVGIPVQDWEEWEHGNMFYLLLQFDGYKFRELKKLPMEYYGGNATRATMIDGWLYVLYGEHMIVQQVFAFDEHY